MSNYCGVEIKPIPDETFFGLVVATGILAGFETYSQAYTHILGKWTSCPASLLPRGLNRLLEFLPSRYLEAPDALCYEHTPLNYFQHFSKPEHMLTAKKTMLTGQGPNIRFTVGLSSTPIKENRWLKYYYACAEEQWDIYDRSTWLRSHQLPGVAVCYRHGLSLIESSIPTYMYGIHSNQIQLPAISSNPQTHEIWSAGDVWKQTSPNRLIAQISHELLMRRQPLGDQCAKRQAYRKELVKSGCTRGGSIDWSKVSEMLRRKYGDLIQRDLGINFSCKENSNWIQRIITTNLEARQHPLQHVLLIGALFDSLDQVHQAIGKEYSKCECQNQTIAHMPSQQSSSTVFADYGPLSKVESVPNISRQTARLKLTAINQRKFELHRNSLLTTMRINPGFTRKHLKRTMGYGYEWLWRYDGEWMRSNLPPKVVNPQALKHTGLKQRRVDWGGLDTKIAMTISELSPSHLVPKPNGKINIAQIARLIDYPLPRLRRLIFLPQTSAALSHIQKQGSSFAAG